MRVHVYTCLCVHEHTYLVSVHFIRQNIVQACVSVCVPDIMYGQSKYTLWFVRDVLYVLYVLCVYKFLYCQVVYCVERGLWFAPLEFGL